MMAISTDEVRDRLSQQLTEYSELRARIDKTRKQIAVCEDKVAKRRLESELRSENQKLQLGLGCRPKLTENQKIIARYLAHHHGVIEIHAELLSIHFFPTIVQCLDRKMWTSEVALAVLRAEREVSERGTPPTYPDFDLIVELGRRFGTQ